MGFVEHWDVIPRRKLPKTSPRAACLCLGTSSVSDPAQRGKELLDCLECIDGGLLCQTTTKLYVIGTWRVVCAPRH